ncbi:MAG: TIGR04282 family arsenosugar biosynthesis glycosyltransferase [Alphaproteobacteria bacterium]|nr:TIGR04282 family arsenosugar biosynthesis glycosyltransferase [Alphaproteobacteria bacterium]
MVTLRQPYRCAIAVMAKAPQSGHSKTRLVPPLDPESAAALSAAFLRDTTGNIALAAQDAPLVGYVAYAPAGTEKLFDGTLAPGTRLLLADGSGPMSSRVQQLGRSLLHALQATLSLGFHAACLLSADSPTLPTQLLRRAAASLAAPGDRIVLGPAEDGGYYLLGTKVPHAHLFEDIDWSTEKVAAQTRARARALGVEIVELPSWYDVDDQASLRRLVAELAGRSDRGLAPYAARATADCVRRLNIADRLAAVA